MLVENILLKANGPKIYLIDNQQIRHITDSNTFISLGLQNHKIKKISQKKLNSLPKGKPITGWQDLSPQIKPKIKKYIQKNNLNVDIIIVNYNSLNFLKNSLASIYQNTEYPFNLILVDNNSTDGSKEYLKGLTGVKTIYNKYNIGCAAGWNTGIKAGKANYIILLNPDTKVTPNWLYPLVKTAAADPKIAIIGVKHVNRSEIIIHAGVIKEKNQLINRSGVKDGPGVFTEPIDLEAIFGACFMIKRNLIPIIGLFDERYFLYAEESDYCLNARKKGYRIRYCPVKIYHYERGSSINPNLRNYYHKQSIELLNSKWKENLYS